MFVIILPLDVIEAFLVVPFKLGSLVQHVAKAGELPFAILAIAYIVVVAIGEGEASLLKSA